MVGINDYMRTRTLGPADIRALTGLTPPAITTVVDALADTRQTGRPRILPHRKRVLLCLVAVRTNLTERDIIVAKATVTLPPGVTTLTDGGYRSLPGATLPPPKTDNHRHAAHRKIRARIEHILARMKDWQMLRQCHRRGDNINNAAQAVAHLYNLNYRRYL